MATKPTTAVDEFDYSRLRMIHKIYLLFYFQFVRHLVQFGFKNTFSFIYYPTLFF